MCKIWLGWVLWVSTIDGYFMPNPLYTYILHIKDLVWLGCTLFNSKSHLYLYIKFI